MDDRDRELLDFARLTWRHRGSMQRELRERFGLSETRFWQRISVLCDDPAAWEYDAMGIKRLRRLRRRAS